ncbi:MAG: hypothetical protein HZB46_17115, partial [Solirubrobacterales bacterium]|nr:hypothetical protein [Solirubrobacterales bacterium]
MDPDDLYGLAPEEFVAARDALAKELRAAGERERAKEVKALAKPSRAAGVVNRLVREHPEEADAVREAARCLEEAQDEVLAGGDPGALREAAEAARAAVERLTARVEGQSAAVREAVRSTLHAATVDADAREEVLGGRLLKERAAAGFGGLDLALAA